MPYSLIISDLHLQVDELEKTQLFTKFCRQYAHQAKQLFILGDLFDVWLGDDVSLAHYRSVIDELRVLSKTTPIFVLVGNRDFLLGAEFEKHSGAKLIREPYLLSTQNGNFVLVHGDTLCSDDIHYQRMKKILRHPWTIWLLLHLPKTLRLRIARTIGEKSIKAQAYKTDEIMDVQQKTVDILMRQYDNAQLIHGHTHRQNVHIEKGYTRFVLGEWSKELGNAIKLDEAQGLDWLKIH